MYFVKHLTLTFWVGLPAKLIILFPPANKYDFNHYVSLNVFA